MFYLNVQNIFENAPSWVLLKACDLLLKKNNKFDVLSQRPTFP